MPRIPGAAAAAALILALPACADELSGGRPDEAPLVVADREFDLPDVPLLPRKKKASLLDALAGKLRGGHAELGRHALVVTSGNSGVRTFTYDEATKSLREQAARRPANGSAANESLGRLQLDLPKQPDTARELKFEFTGGVDEFGVLLTKKM
jgi:hypothetical protein